MVQNANLIEIQNLKSAHKSNAKVVCVDYLANLAILQEIPKAGQDPLSKNMVPIEIAEKLLTDDEVDAWQFEANGHPVVTKGKMLIYMLRVCSLNIYFIVVLFVCLF